MNRDYCNLDLKAIEAARKDPSASVRKILSGVIGPKIHNVVLACKACLPPGFTWDVKRLAFPAYGKYKKSEYAAPFTLACKGATCVFVKTGKVNILGAKTVAESVKKIYECQAYLYKLTKFRMRVHDLTLTNMQATINLGYTIDLPAMKKRLLLAVYNPTVISHLKYTIHTGSGAVTFLIYPSGRIVLTEAIDMAQFVEARNIFLPFVAMFALHPNTPEGQMDTSIAQLLEDLNFDEDSEIDEEEEKKFAKSLLKRKEEEAHISDKKRQAAAAAVVVVSAASPTPPAAKKRKIKAS